MTAREMANIQMLLYIAKKELGNKFSCDRADDLQKTIWEVEDFLEKQGIELPPVNWKPYY